MPSSMFYPLFYPEPSDTTSLTAFLCSFSFSFISMLSHPSCTTSLFLLCCPVLPPAWFPFASWISHFSSQLFSPPSTACLPCLPEERLMLLTCKLILHRNLYLPDSVGSVYLIWVSYDETINWTRKDVHWYKLWLEALQLLFSMNGHGKAPGDSKAYVGGQGNSTAGLTKRT